MTIEKIKDALRVCSTQDDCYGCPYEISSVCKKQKDKDALNAIIELEEQISAMESGIKNTENRLIPRSPEIKTNDYGWKFYYCPNCGREFYGNREYGFFDRSKFCPDCGQEMKWE